jgi:FkbM family methyltransferase
VRDVQLRLPVPEASGTPPVEAAPGDGPRLRLVAPDTAYVPKLLQRHALAGYEPETMACFLAAIEALGGPVFDVGANVGIFSLVARASFDVEVVGFEPTPDLAELFRDQCARNELAITVEELALGASAGTATFYLSNVTDSSNSLLAGFRPSDVAIEVRTDTLDGYVERTGHVPRVLKIDTEATEPDVLRGAARLLEGARPWVICEVLARRTETELEELLGPLDYRWYQITSELPLRSRRELFGDRAYRFNNWLFAPEPADDAFWERMRIWSRAIASCEPLPSASPPAPATEPSPSPTTATIGAPPEDAASPPATSAGAPPGTPVPPVPPEGDAPPRRDDSSATTPRRRARGVYGRKKLLAATAAGAVAGVLLGRVSARGGRDRAARDDIRERP